MLLRRKTRLMGGLLLAMTGLAYMLVTCTCTNAATPDLSGTLHLGVDQASSLVYVESGAGQRPTDCRLMAVLWWSRTLASGALCDVFFFGWLLPQLLGTPTLKGHSVTVEHAQNSLLDPVCHDASHWFASCRSFRLAMSSVIAALLAVSLALADASGAFRHRQQVAGMRGCLGSRSPSRTPTRRNIEASGGSERRAVSFKGTGEQPATTSTEDLEALIEQLRASGRITPQPFHAGQSQDATDSQRQPEYYRIDSNIPAPAGGAVAA
mmetsp:Transcript_104491/g.207543  ORF Transcript_104491/g.207543 Transcript_104491/m.207543 type:complete len:266 (+) Transcript_104491:57-854(+)